MRLLGVLVFSACAVFIFYEYVRSEKLRLREYGALVSLLMHVEGEVSEGGRALSEALRCFGKGDGSTEPLKQAILSADAEKMRCEMPETDICDLNIISELISGRAASSAKEEGERIRKVLTQINDKYAALKEGHSDKIKVALTLLCTAIAFAFFLLA